MEANFAQNSPKLSVSLPSSPTQRSIFEAGLLVVIIVLLYFFVVSPKKADLKTQTAVLAEKKEAEELSTKNLENLQGLVGKLASHKAQFEKLDESLPLVGKTIHLRMLVESLAESSGVTLTSINVTNKGEGVVAGDAALIANPFSVVRELQPLTASVTATGNFDQLFLFLRKIENNARVMNLAGFELSGQGENLLSMKVDFSAYFYGPVK